MDHDTGGAGQPRRDGGARQRRGAGKGPGSGDGSRQAGAGSTAVEVRLAQATSVRPVRQPKLSKDAYRRQREAMDAELTRLNLRKNHLELELSNPRVQANFIELRRVSSELADVDTALSTAEDAWLALEERAP